MFWKKTEMDEFVDFIVDNMRNNANDWTVTSYRVYNRKLDICFWAPYAFGLKFDVEDIYTKYPEREVIGKTFAKPYDFSKKHRNKIFEEISKLSKNSILQNYKELSNK